MAKIAGIIAEYNPFHLGHQYQMETLRRQTRADYIVVMMSGNFVQRGEPALFETDARVRMALLGGADLVLELPALFSTGSAEDFARGAVSLLEGLGCISFLSFGSESGDVEPLWKVAEILAMEPPAFSKALAPLLSAGLPFPKARAQALAACGLEEEVLKEAAKPNNLLGIEYLKALLLLRSSITPVVIQRKGRGYHDQCLEGNTAGLSPDPDRNKPGSIQKEDFSFASASAIRSAILEASQRAKGAGNFLPLSREILAQIPSALHPLYTGRCPLPIAPDDCSSILNYQLLTCIRQGWAFREFSDISPELEGRLMQNALIPQSFSQRIMALKTKQYTYTRISRGLLHILLDIRREDMARCRRNLDYGYARLLGWRRSSAPLLTILKEHSAIPLVSKASDAPHILEGNALSLWHQHVSCSHIYHILMEQRYGGMAPKWNEYSRPMVIL